MTFPKTADRLRGQLANHPRAEGFRITRKEAQAVVAGAPIEILGIDTMPATRRVLAKIVHRLMGKTDEVTDFVEEQLRDSRFFDQELTRRVEFIDRRLATLAEAANEARRDLRDGKLPDFFVDHSGFDQLLRELRTSTGYVDHMVGGALSYAYLLRNQAAQEAAS